MHAHIAAFVLVLLSVLAPRSRAFDIDPPAIRKALEDSWRAIRTLEVHGNEYAAESNGERATKNRLWTHTFDFHHAPGAKRALNIQYFRPDGQFDHGEDCREDGRKIYRLRPYQQHADVIDEMMVSAQTDTILSQRDMLNSLFVWCWTPAGRATHTLLGPDCRYESTRDGEGRSLVRVTIPKENLTLDLDPSVGYAARHIRLGDGFQVTATKFEQVGGVWLPMRGFCDHGRSRVPGSLHYEGFEVSQVRVNEPIPESTFTVAKPDAGVLIYDRTQGKNRVQGGVAARTARHKANPSLKEATGEPAKPSPTIPPIQAQGSVSPWAIALFAASGLFLGGAWMLKSRLA
ncbi:MAG: hypothetical protein U0800_06795 [Isosphaeraceae bacterium]